MRNFWNEFIGSFVRAGKFARDEPFLFIFAIGVGLGLGEAVVRIFPEVTKIF